MDSPGRLRALDTSSTLTYLARRNVPPWLLVLVGPPILLIMVGLATAAQGTLFHTATFTTLLHDVATLFGATASGSDAYFPFARDYPSIIGLTSTGVTMGLMYRNALLMERFLPELRRNGLLIVRAPNIDRAGRALDKVNRAFAGIRRARLAVLAVSAAIAVLLMAAARSGDTFRPLVGASSDHTLYARAYSGWWAGVLREHWLGATTYLVGATFVVYVIIKHNLIGTCFVCFFVISRGAIEYRADQQNVDGYHGWLVMRLLMITILTSLTVSIVAFGSLFMLLPIACAPWTAPFLLLYFIGLPTDILAPTLLLNGEMERFRKREIEVIRRNTERRLQDLPAYSLAWHELMAAERAAIESIRTLKPRLFRTRTVALAGAIYIFAAIASIAQVVISYLQVLR